MATITRGAMIGEAKINDRYLAGYPSVQPPLNMYFSAPLPPHKQAFAVEALQQLFPGANTFVKGGLWDYGLSESALHRETAVGRFGVSINNQEMIMTVHRYPATEDLALGHTSFKYYHGAGIEVINSIPDSQGIIEHGVKGPDGNTYHVNFSRFPMGLSWVGRTKDKVDGYGLGSLAATLAQSAQVMPSEHKRALAKYTEATSDHFHRVGFVALAGDDEGQAISYLFTGQDALRDQLMGAIEHAHDVLDHNPRMPNYGGLTEKTVWIGNAVDVDDYYLIDHSLPARSFHPMLEGNVSYDAGMVALRILLNKDLYSGTEAEVRDAITSQLKVFTKVYGGYGLHATADEVLEAAKTAAVFVGAHEAGLYLCGGKNDLYTAPESENRIRRLLPVMAAQIEEIDSYMGVISPQPRPGAEPLEPGL